MAPKQALVSQKSIATEALRLMDEQGLEAVSMRTLASRLGVTAMALYRYYPRKDSLLNTLVDLVLQEMAPPPESESWEERLIAMASNYRRILLAHPNALPLFASQPAFSLEALRGFEQGLATLQQGGFDDVTMIRGYYAVFNYALGFVTTETSRLKATQTTGETGGADPYDTISPEQFPLIAALNPRVPMLGDDQFLFGLRLLVHGLRHALP